MLIFFLKTFSYIIYHKYLKKMIKNKYLREDSMKPFHTYMVYGFKDKILNAKIFWFFLVFLHVSVVNAYAGNEAVTSLFIPVDLKSVKNGDALMDGETPANQQHIHINVIPLKTRSEEFSKLHLSFLRHSIVAERIKLLSESSGGYTWIGKPESSEGIVVMSVYNNTIFGCIELEDETYKIEPVRGTNTHRIFKLDPDEAWDIDAGGLAPQWYELPDEILRTPSISKGVDDGETFDILILYTSGFAEVYPGDELNAQINYLVGVANACYSNSEVNLTARVVGIREVNYKDSGMMKDALGDLTYGNGAFSNIASLRNKLGADLVTLLRIFKDSNDACGLAWQMSLLSDSFEKWAFSVVQVGMIPHGSGHRYCTDQTLAHEMGHNMGCAHLDGSGAVFEYSKGYVFSPYMSVMASSGGTRVSHFSNPNVSYAGFVTGADDANNARSINKVKLTISRFRNSKCLGSITASADKLSLKREESVDVVFTIKGEYDYPEEGELVKTRVNAAGKKLISVLPKSDTTDSNGQITFTIIAKKAGKARVAFKSGCLKKSITIKIK